MAKRLTTDDFIQKAKKIHGDRYDYSRVHYINAKSDVEIVCPIHGLFKQIAGNHLAGKGCAQCAGNKPNTLDDFIQKAKKVHGNKYDYSKVMFTRNRDKVTIICPVHGEFIQEANSHLQGVGCPSCFTENKRGKFNMQSRDKKSRSTWLSKYGVDNPMKVKSVAVKNRQAKIQNDTYEHSELEDRLYTDLVSKFGADDVVRQYSDDVRYPFYCDFYIKSRDLFIEYNAHFSHGAHWALFDDAFKYKSRDKYDILKRSYAKAYCLNYVVFWTSRYDDVNLWFASGCPDSKDWLYEYEWIKKRDLQYPMRKLKTGSYQELSAIAKFNQQNVFFAYEKNAYANAFDKTGRPMRLELAINRYNYLHKTPDELSDRELLSAFAISGKYRGFSTFDVRLVEQFLLDYKPQSVYDPFAGWGERGLLAKKHGIDYQGVDLNIALVSGYKRMGLNVNISDSQYFIPNKSADCVITCPPYFDIEHYTDVGLENSSSHDEFVEGLTRVFDNCNNISIFAIQVNQYCKQDVLDALRNYKLERVYKSANNKKSHLQKQKHEFEELLVLRRK